MSLRINQNIDAMNSYRNLSVTQGQMSKKLRRRHGFARGALSTEVLESTTGWNVEESRQTSDAQRMLVAGIGGGRRVAIPLSSVTRLEHVAATAVEVVGSREVVQYRGAILPLLRLNNHLGAMSEREGDDLVVVVYSAGARSVAIVVDEIIDIVDEDGDLRSDIDDYGLLGSALIRERIVEVLDVRAAILSADPPFYEPAAAHTHDLAEAADERPHGHLHPDGRALRRRRRGSPGGAARPDPHPHPPAPPAPSQDSSTSGARCSPPSTCASSSSCPHREPEVEPMLVVIRVSGEPIALLVDSIGSVVDVDPDQFETPPDTLTGPLGS